CRIGTWLVYSSPHDQWVMSENPGIWEVEAVCFGPSGQRNARNRGRLADADGLHIRFDELHGVVDRHPGFDGPARTVEVELDVLVRILGLEKQHLRDHKIGDLIVDRRPD